MPAGGIGATAGSGLTLRGTTGGTYDFQIRDAAGTSTIAIPTGTTEVVIAGVSGDGTGKVLCIKADTTIGYLQCVVPHDFRLHVQLGDETPAEPDEVLQDARAGRAQLGALAGAVDRRMHQVLVAALTADDEAQLCPVRHVAHAGLGVARVLPTRQMVRSG